MSRRIRLPASALAALLLPALAIGGSLGVSSCGGKREISPPPETPVDRKRREELERQQLEDGFSISDLFEDGDDGNAGGGMPVNRHLWSASLEVLSFLPLASTDSTGGVIITEWATLDGAPDEQLKVVANVLSPDLRTNGIRVKVFRREQGEDGSLRDAPVDPATERALEDRILTRARELYVAERS